jgi:hypothetical protein
MLSTIPTQIYFYSRGFPPPGVITYLNGAWSYSLIQNQYKLALFKKKFKKKFKKIRIIQISSVT